jgi:hypothetical protein
MNKVRSSSFLWFLAINICLFLLPRHIAFSQEDTTTTPTFASVCIGYSSYLNYSVYADIYDDAVFWYQRQNVSFAQLSRLGPSIIIDGELYFATSPLVGVGIAYGYTSSTASAAYKGDARTIDLHAHIVTHKYLFIIQFNAGSYRGFSFFVRLKPGFFNTDFISNEEIRYYNSPVDNETTEFHVTGTGLYAEPTVGVSHSLGFLIASLETGYRYGHLLSHTATITSSNNKSEGRLNSDIIQSGFFGLLSLGIEL